MKEFNPFSPGNEEICFMCPYMQKCTDIGEIPPCVKRVEVQKPSHNSVSREMPEYGIVENKFNEWWHKEGQGVDKLTYRNMHKFFGIIARHFGQ
jgi:hypothetical protein